MQIFKGDLTIITKNKFYVQQMRSDKRQFVPRQSVSNELDFARVCHKIKNVIRKTD